MSTALIALIVLSIPVAIVECVIILVIGSAIAFTIQHRRKNKQAAEATKRG
jgi:heme/copper-type cytochrome/quinol oxidase subunit 2